VILPIFYRDFLTALVMTTVIVTMNDDGQKWCHQLTYAW